MCDFNVQFSEEEKYHRTVGHYPAHKRTTRDGRAPHRPLRQVQPGRKVNHLGRQRSGTAQTMFGKFQVYHVAIHSGYHKEIQKIKVPTLTLITTSP